MVRRLNEWTPREPYTGTIFFTREHSNAIKKLRSILQQLESLSEDRLYATSTSSDLLDQVATNVDDLESLVHKVRSSYTEIPRKNESKQRTRKRSIKESPARSMNIDMWYGDPIKRGYYGADAYFNDLSATYSGNIYDPETGEIVGDYTCDDSTEIEKMFKVEWD